MFILFGYSFFRWYNSDTNDKSKNLTYRLSLENEKKKIKKKQPYTEVS